ncbi:PREDICTED: uncharacterized protein LOC104789604 [Camelina sativa]|uniref:Uncharacterized protein LOC104789604 n=1 Tax=Camelina sativa TaxID=90675 RepID=A0ABM0ZC27_CAMSA|nr:PREDICTED: uncharacterized protein LOC104789604 [Camelina sativa]
MAIQHEVPVEEKEEERGPSLDQFTLYPLYKGMLLNISKQKAQNQAKKDLEEIGTAMIPTKLEDPSSFNLPCSLSYMHFNKCLCDLGASVSVMPYSVAEKLGSEEFKPSNLYISLADGSSKDVIGKLEEFPFKIGKARIPTDFVIIEMDKELEDPIILGRPFLATAGAIIDVKKGLISLNIAQGLKMKFDIKNSANQPTIEEDSKAKDSAQEESIQELKDSVQELTDLVKDLQVQLNKRSLKKARPRYKLKKKQSSSVKTKVIKNKLHGDQVEPGGSHHLSGLQTKREKARKVKLRDYKQAH